MLRVFQRLSLPMFTRATGEDFMEFLSTCQEQLQLLGLVESKGANFSAHYFIRPAR